MKNIIPIFAFVSAFALFGLPAVASADAEETLNDLIKTVIDSQYGFQQAAEKASVQDLKKHFLAEAAEREKFARQLQEAVIDLGEAPKQRGSIGAEIKRVWRDIKSSAALSDVVVLKRVKEDEEDVLKDYKAALKETLPRNARQLVEKQKKNIESSYRWTVKRIKQERKKSLG